MLAIVAKVAPSIYDFCKNVYSIQPVLNFHSNEIRSATGMQQGDPLGSLLFCLAIQPNLDQLGSELIIGYLDDVTLGGNVKTVRDDFELMKFEGERLGLKFNISKCEVLTRNNCNLDIANTFPGFQMIDIRDAQLLGSPILSDRGLDVALDDKCNELQNMLSRLKHLSAHHSLVIIRHCISVPTVMHILRTNNNCHDNDRLIMFDNIVRRGLEAILNVELSTLQWTQACLPIRDGGLGVRTTDSLATSAFLASAMSTLALQELILPSVANTIESAVVASQERWKVITLEQPITGDLACKQRSWDDAVVRRTKKDLTEKLTNDIQLARFTGAQYVHAGDWHNASPIANCGLHLDDETMRIAIYVSAWEHKYATFTHVHVGHLSTPLDSIVLFAEEVPATNQAQFIK